VGRAVLRLRCAKVTGSVATRNRSATTPLNFGPAGGAR
jgi:hypothetical protein